MTQVPRGHGGERGDVVLQLATGFWAPRCLHVVAELGIADHLDDEPRTAAELAAAVGVNTDALNRILRLLASNGIFEASERGYAHNDASRTLRSDHPRSKRAYVVSMGGKMEWMGWASFDKIVRNGRPATNAGDGLFSRLSADPAAAKQFDEAMIARSHGEVAAILKAYNFAGIDTIVDVGGGRGHLLRAVVKATPSANGIVFDLPHVVANIAPSDRMTAVGGDFFKDVLPSGDAYLLMNVLHDWPDDEAARIAAAIATAAPRGAKLLVLEAIVPQGSEPHWSKVLDINMLRIGGRERTEKEYLGLLSAAGFRHARTIATESPYSIMEAVAG